MKTLATVFVFISGLFIAIVVGILIFGFGAIFENAVVLQDTEVVGTILILITIVLVTLTQPIGMFGPTGRVFGSKATMLDVILNREEKK